MIVALFPGLLTTGGVQLAGRYVAATLATYAQQRGQQYHFLSLDDPPGFHPLSVAHDECIIQGFGHQKRRFILAALQRAAAQPRLLLAAHPNMAPLASMSQLIAPAMRSLALAYGIEVWDPLPPLSRFTLQRTDMVMAISSDTIQKLTTIQRVAPHKVKLLPLALDPALHRISCMIEASSLPAGFPHGRVILSVGRMAASERYKGMDCTIEALTYLLPDFPDLHLALVGDGDDRPRLIARANERGVSGHVHFLGRLPQEALVACYQRCELFALPSAGEGFGLVFLEAMVQSKPVIGGAHGGTPDIIEDGVTGLLVRHGDIKQLVTAMRRLLDDPQLRQEMGQRAKAHVEKVYLYSHFQQRLIQMVDDVAGSPTAASTQRERSSRS